MQKFGKRIGYLHFSDSKGRRDDHLALGKETINFQGLVRSLNKVGYDDSLTLEVFEQDRSQVVAGGEQLKKL